MRHMIKGDDFYYIKIYHQLSKNLVVGEKGEATQTLKLYKLLSK